MSGAALHAQTNLALTATAANSGGGTGVWGPANLNDNDSPMGSYNDCWTSAGGWISLTWSSAQTIASMKI